MKAIERYRRKRWRVVWGVLLACSLSAGEIGLSLAWPSISVAQGTENPVQSAGKARQKPQKVKRDLTMKTLGGRQFWGDAAVFHDWRIQKNILTGHYRLLDGEDFRHVSGTFAECQDKLTRIKQQQKLPPMQGKAVLFVHGIVRSSKSFSKLRERLKKQGYHVFGFDYPSTQVTIPECAEFLHSVIESMDGIEEINFVVHSMGGLVVRAYLAKHRDKRIKRMVMMAVPNLGAQMADHVKQNPLFRMIFGPAGQQLGSDPNGLIAKLPTPDFEFAIIAGIRGSINGYNLLIPGDDDGTVSVASTRLPGAADFIAVRGLHSWIMNHDEAVDCTTRFLKTGRLRETGDPHPIPRPEKKSESKTTSKKDI